MIGLCKGDYVKLEIMVDQVALQGMIPNIIELALQEPKAITKVL